MPFREALRLLRAVKSAVDLDRCELTAGIFELTFLREFVGVERPPPGLVGPTADADPNRARDRCSAHLLPFRSAVSGKVLQKPTASAPPSTVEHTRDVSAFGRRGGNGA